ncbi:alanine dehydrogenase [Sedimentibacter sp. zth1]|uniref:alanine dehydrogenase n=1 Tax=Sedimentibacter sp. zth1 TaxID=2816908 RepID=UPI001A936313|nr:alanine dehydrogenase [Sedimentibacter sp. zth1]QSX06254.1 alanine dehydrogenase [Sedimentibacter sp. zth1]
MKKSYGFPKMNKEIEEVRAFLPSFFRELKEANIDIWLENNYGEEMGLSEDDYLKENKHINFVKRDIVFSKDVVVVLRTPESEDLKKMKSGSILVSMLHYITRESRNLLMKRLGIISFSMDSMIDDDNRRVVVNFYETAFSGAQQALNKLEINLENKSLNRPVNVVIIGIGVIGLTVAKAFKDLSNEKFYKLNEEYGGLKITLLTRSMTGNSNLFRDELKKADILVDASSRKDTSKYIVTNQDLKELPLHSIILDITADPYDFKKEPHQVKAIEGIPTGTLDQLVFKTDDRAYDEINNFMNTINRRLVVSCNAWPGVNPIVSMKLYGRQLLPILRVLINKEHEQLSVDSKNYYERILARSSYEYFENYMS